MSNFIGAVWMFLLMPILIIGYIIHTQKELRAKREKVEKEIANYADVL